MDRLDFLADFARDFGLYALLGLLAAKFVLGVLVAIKEGEFKWYYLGNILKDDALKLTAYVVLAGIGQYAGVPEFSADVIRGVVGALLMADFIGGVVKNAVHFFPQIGGIAPKSMREPERLRLGNPGNTLK